MSKKFVLLLVFIMLVTSIIVAACGSASTPVPTATTATPFLMAGCNVLKDEDGMLWFDFSHEGVPFTLSEDQSYIFQPEFFSYYRVDCVQGYPRVILGLADVDCKDQKIRWERDGGWSCWIDDILVFQAGGNYLWPRGKPEGYIDPPPIIPEFPFFPSEPPRGENG